MKKILFLLLMLASVGSYGQCGDYFGQWSFYLPITDVNEVNNTIGDKNFVNLTNITHQVGNNINFGDWLNMSFVCEGTGGILVNQVVNMSSGSQLYLKGDVTLNTLNMSAGTHPDWIYVEDNSNIYVNNVQYANNTLNYVLLGQNTVFTANGQIWEAGDTMHLTNNPSNVIIFEQCQGIPLPIEITYFEAQGATISWRVTNAPLTIQKLVGENWEDRYASFSDQDRFKVKESGYYRGVTEGDVSKPVHCIVSSLPDPTTIYDVQMRVITDPQLLTPYFRGGKGFIIVQN